MSITVIKENSDRIRAVYNFMERSDEVLLSSKGINYEDIESVCPICEVDTSLSDTKIVCQDGGSHVCHNCNAVFHYCRGVSNYIVGGHGPLQMNCVEYTLDKLGVSMAQFIDRYNVPMTISPLFEQ